MELSTTLVFLILGFSFSFCAILVDSQDNVNVPVQPSLLSPPPPPTSPPPPPSPSPPPPPSSPPPPPFSQPPPPPQTPPSPPPPSPLPRPPPPPPKRRFPRPNPPPHPKKNTTLSSQSNHNVHNEAVNRDKHGGKKVQPEHKNWGKTIGLLFIGVIGVLQICVVGLLVFKRQQLLKTKDRYETCS